MAKFSLSIGINHFESSSAFIKIDVEPCVTAVLKLLPLSEGLYWPVWSLNLYTPTTIYSFDGGNDFNDRVAGVPSP